MTGNKLIKMAPTLLLVAFLGYSIYTVEPGLPDPTSLPAELGKGLEIMADDVIEAGASATRTVIEEGLRDPFQISSASVGAAGSTEAQSEAASDPKSDPLAEIVAGLKLDATLLQGRDQVAIIGGRFYSRGQHLRLNDGGGKGPSPLLVVSILQTKVVLKGNDRTYVLGYPEQLGQRKDKSRELGPSMPNGAAMPELDPAGQNAMFQKLLNSPLGAMGKSLIGNATSNDPRTRSDRSSP